MTKLACAILGAAALVALHFKVEYAGWALFVALIGIL